MNRNQRYRHRALTIYYPPEATVAHNTIMGYVEIANLTQQELIDFAENLVKTIRGLQKSDEDRGTNVIIDALSFAATWTVPTRWLVLLAGDDPIAKEAGIQKHSSSWRPPGWIR